MSPRRRLHRDLADGEEHLTGSTMNVSPSGLGSSAAMRTRYAHVQRHRGELPADYSALVSRYAAFLRGVNLGPRRRVSSTELLSLFEGIGLEHVATFRTSGNVVFDAGRESPTTLAGRIEKGLAQSLGFEVAVFLRTAEEIRAMADHKPFDRRLVEASQGKLQVALLSAKPAAQARREALALATEEDRLAFGDRELYWLPSGGIRDAALDFKAIERLLGSATMRTKRTIDELAGKYFPA